MRLLLSSAVAASAALLLHANAQDARASCDPSRWRLPVDGRYDTAAGVSTDKLNVHLIPHSHDDPGWLITVDQYYMERVQFILDTAVEELLRDPNRKFMFVEQSFFQRWWQEQSSHVKRIVKQLVKEGRLDLSVNGGWCMHDEATPHYSAMVDQTAYGHKLLLDEFGISPRIGWQIDPFGHSSTQGSLLSQGVGFDALYFARIDYQDYNERKRTKNLEFVWRPSKSRGKNSQVFTGEIMNMYIPPDKYDYSRQNHYIQDDPALHDFNVCDQVDDFVKISLDRAASSRGRNIFIPMGLDFTYDNSRRWFKNMDKLIHYVNQDNRINVLYSNLSYYTDLKHAENITWSVKTDDFFPYGSDRDDYWSGYFTSRPGLKRFARVSNILLQQVRQIDAIYQSHHSAELDALERAVGLVQHHDGLSGTEKQAVSDDYALRLNDGIIEAEKGLNEILFVIGSKEPYHLCLLANTSVCDVSTQNEEFEVLVHNALARKSIETISIPVAHKSVEISALDGAGTIRHQNVYDAIPVHPETQVAPYKLVFSTELGPLSVCRFLVKQKSAEQEAPGITNSDTSYYEKTVTIENELVRAVIDTETGSITKLTNKQKKIDMPLSLDIAYYQAFQNTSGHCSGAYAFRPDSNKTYSVLGNGSTSTSAVRMLSSTNQGSNNLLSQVSFQSADWVTVEYRLNDGDEFLEIEWTVGPVPIDDNLGKEVIVRFDTSNNIESASTFFTDSNGLEFVKRVRNHRDTWNLTLHDDQERVSANYFPITTSVYIQDNKHQLNVITDRAQGASSLKDGQIEVMVHRRLLADDNKGVNEHLNETEVVLDSTTKKLVTKGLTVRGSFFVNVDTAQDGMKAMRSKMEKTFYKPLVAFRKPDSSDVHAKLPWLTVSEFPPNVGLTTLAELSKRCVMTRLTHLYSVEEHKELSTPVTVDFSKLFSVKGGSVTEVKELSLTGVKELSVSLEQTNALQWKTDESSVEYEDVSEPSIPVSGTSVVLQPMEVRTFRVCFGKSVSDADALIKAVETPKGDAYRIRYKSDELEPTPRAESVSEVVAVA